MALHPVPFSQRLGSQAPDRPRLLGDVILSFRFFPGWEDPPHDQEHMNDNPQDLWMSNDRTVSNLRINHTDKTWPELLVLRGKRPKTEVYQTKTGISVIMTVKEPDLSGAFECFGSRYEFSASRMRYVDLRTIFDLMACQTVKEKKTPKPKRKRKKSSEPSL